VPLTYIIFLTIGQFEPTLCNLLMTVGMPNKSIATSDIFNLRCGRKIYFQVLPSTLPHEYAPRLPIFWAGLPITCYQSHDFFAHYYQALGARFD